MNDKQRRFCELYDGNRKKTAIKAGYESGIITITPEMRKYLKEREQKNLSSEIADRKERQKFWTNVMRNDKETTTDRMRASELLGKSEADFTENLRMGFEIPDDLKKMSDAELIAFFAKK